MSENTLSENTPSEKTPSESTQPEDLTNDSDSAVIDQASNDDVAIPAASTGSPVADRVYDLLAPVVATADVELLDVEWTGGTLQVVVDHADGVTVDNLATVNRLISPLLDQHDPVPGRYTLEVTSPGVERPLRRAEHYQRAVGENIVVKNNPGIEPRRVRGLLQSAGPSSVSVEVVEIDGVDLEEVQNLTLEIADVATARTIFDWGPTPKPGTARPEPKGKTATPRAKQEATPRKPQKQSQRKTKKSAGARKSAGAKKSPEAKKSGADPKQNQETKNQIEQNRNEVGHE